MKKMAKKVVKHLKADIKTFKHEAKEDKALIKKLSHKKHEKHEKHEKQESKKHKKKEDRPKRDPKKVAVKIKIKVKVKPKKRNMKKRSPKGAKVEKVMHEFKEGVLHSGSKRGPVVSNPKQAIAIALSEQRKANK